MTEGQKRRAEELSKMSFQPTFHQWAFQVGYRAAVGDAHLLAMSFAEVLKRWDALGEYKDDDFGEVQEAMEWAREALKKWRDG